MTDREFRERHATRGEDGRLQFAARPCSFLEGNLCSVYEDRPKNCRDYPNLHKDFRPRSLQFLMNSGTCPIVFKVLEELKRRLPQ